MIDIDDYDEVFTPGRTVRPELFAGRSDDLRTLQKYLTRPGIHPLVIGPRGVGKTSFVSFSLSDSPATCIRITCNALMSFDVAAHEILRQIGADADTLERTESKGKEVELGGTPFGIGAKTKGIKASSTKHAALGSRSLDPWQLFVELRRYGKKTFIILDEFDVVSRSESDLPLGMAGLIKTLADNCDSCDTRVILIGLNTAASHWLAQHESIHRSARELPLAPLENVDIIEFLERAEAELGMAFSSSVKSSLVNDALGFPFYVHLVGLECIEAMRERDPDGRTVISADYEAAIRRAVKAAFRSELQKYRGAVAELGRLGAEVLKELLLYSRDARAPLESIQQRVALHTGTSPEAVRSTLKDLVGPNGVLFYAKNKGELRFREPLMAPFLRSYLLPPEHRQSSLYQRDQLSLFQG